MIPLFLLTVHYVDFKLFVLSIIRGTLHPQRLWFKRIPINSGIPECCPRCLSCGHDMTCIMPASLIRSTSVHNCHDVGLDGQPQSPERICLWLNISRTADACEDMLC